MITTINEFKIDTYKQQISKYVVDSKEFKTIDTKVKRAYMNWIESDFDKDEQLQLTFLIKKQYSKVPNEIKRVKKDLKILDIINGKILERNDFDAVSNIGKITKEITIELDLKHSYHSMERQGRSSEFIKNSDIKSAVEKATEQIVDLLINNTLNAGDPVWIYDTSNDLNVVGGLIAKKNSDIIIFKLITCMFSKEFYNKNKTYKVTV